LNLWAPIPSKGGGGGGRLPKEKSPPPPFTFYQRAGKTKPSGSRPLRAGRNGLGT